MAEWGLEDHHIDYARGNAARLASTIRWEAQTESRIGQWFVDWRGGEARGAAFGTWVEGSAALWRLAAIDSRMADLRDEIEERSTCGASILVDRQEPVDAEPVQAGAWFTDDVTRMDDQQHVISGLVYTADAIEGVVHREPPQLGVGRVPPQQPLAEPEENRKVVDRLLSPLLLILVINPLVPAMVVTGFGGRTSSLRLSRVWSLAATIVLALAALLAEPTLDLLDISLPSWYLAAGALVVVAVLRLFIERDPFTPTLTDDAPDWLAIIWGIGWIATPAAVAVVMAHSLDLHYMIAFVSAALAVTVASIGALLGPAILARIGYRRMRELARWTSLLALLPAAKLILDGLNGV
jgi:small neutral amino acid transporter SnatA (MarC family)